MDFLSVLLLLFFFYFFCCFGEKRYNVWHLNQSFTLNSSDRSSSFNVEPNSYTFPLINPEDFHTLNPEVFYAPNGTEDYRASAYLCFISPVSSPPSQYTLSICMGKLVVYNSTPRETRSTMKWIFFADAIIWSANRGNPVRGENVSLAFGIDGNLVLRGEAGNPVWATNTSNKGVVRMKVSQDPINLVLYDSNNRTVWQSLDYPTDTLTNYQTLKEGMKLVSWASPTDSSEGNYSLVVEPAGMVLYLTSFPTPQPYWVAKAPYRGIPACAGRTLQLLKNSSCLASKGPATEMKASEASSGGFTFDITSDSIVLEFGTEYWNNGPGSFLRLEWNGNLREYVIPGTTGSTVLYNLFDASESCFLPMHCGPYGVCRGEGQCSCPLPTSGNSASFVMLSEITQSCGLAQPFSCSHNNASSNLQMLEFNGLDYFSNNYTSPLINLRTEESCKNQCFQNCSCQAAFWHNHSRACFHVDHMGGLLGSLNNSYRAFLKVGITASGHSAPTTIIGVVSGLVALLVLSSLLYIIYRRVSAGLEKREEEEEEEEAFLDAIPGLPTRFSYKELHSVTNGFANKLGQGGFGAVYAGTFLTNECTKVAVKQLEGVRQGDKEFRSEVAIMGGIHHFNLLRLRGFCAQGRHRLLVYDYMEHGSLDQWLFINHRDNMKTPLAWNVRFKIVVGAARGIAYLHEDCRERIIHMDIKPQNILLDHNFVAKVADFGLSRLMERDKSHVMTTMRGTPGYLAPEWLKEGSIDEKCDVFSFGMLLMEIISGRKNLDLTIESKEQTYYPEWAFWKAQHGSDVADLTDAKVESEEERFELRRMINTSFLCVLENPTLRPSMEKVVQMLEGHVPVSHIQLASLHQGLLFVLRNPSAFSQTQIEEALALPSANSQVASGSGGVSSFHISTR